MNTQGECVGSQIYLYNFTIPSRTDAFYWNQEVGKIEIFDQGYFYEGISSNINKKGEVHFLLVKHGKGHWGFPKGHAEKGETERETALRELREETGVTDCKLPAGKTFLEKYTFRHDGKLIFKSVKYFLGKVHDTAVRIDPKEISDYRWASFDKAATLITFKESLNLLKKARTAVMKLGDS